MTTETLPRDRARSGPLFALIAAVAIAAGLRLGGANGHDLSEPAPLVLVSATLLPQPRPLADFALVDQDGQPFSLANLRGRWTFLAIGYTHCPDVCPTTLATFAAVQGRIAALSSKGEAVAPSQFLFISVDPERDSPERLAHYVRYFDPAFLGATGDDAQLRVLVAQLGLLYAKVEDQDTAMGYLVDHSAWILLVDPEGRLTAVYMPPHDPERIAADFFSIEAATLPEKPPGSPPPSPIMSSPIPPQ